MRARARETKQRPSGIPVSPGAKARDLYATNSLSHLQHTVGNQAVQHLIRADTTGSKVSTATARNTAGVEQALSSPGRPLGQATRDFMEARLEYDFGDVRVHDNAAASKSARTLGARAFTAGRDIVFGAGEHAPDTGEGKHLLAHELAHVVQQRADQGAPRYQRMTVGSGTPPAHWVKKYNAIPVPADDRERVDAAIEMMREVATNADSYSSCHQLFHDECPGGSASSLSDTFTGAVLWKAERPGALAFAQAPGTNVAYTQSGYDDGTSALASTLIHELLHNCGLSGNKYHYLADVAGLYCIGEPNKISVSSGAAINASLPYVLISYRRLLAELGNGQLELTAGADLNLAGAIAAPISDDIVTEVASAMVGLHGRTNLLFGGERFGGLTAKIEPGIAFGRFRVQDAETATSREELGAGFVLQTGIGAEFYIPDGASAFPISVEAAYRLVVPLNQPAEEIHGILGTVGFHF